LPLPIPALLHLVFPVLRVLLLVPLFFGLVFPRVVYTPVEAGDDADEYNATDSTFLLSAAGAPPSTGLSPVPGLSGEASKYGTFQSAHPAVPPSGPVTRAQTPVPSHGNDKVCITRIY
jgi:ATP-binding cassette subfamily B (MDR/TAP) protein 6